MGKKSLNPRDIIRKLSLGGDGQNGDTKGSKQTRFLMELIDGKKKHEQIRLLRELYPKHSVWTEIDIPIEPLSTK